MDKCREEFEAYFKEHHADSFYSVDVALEMRGDDYIDFLASDLWAIWQHKQAKVEELQVQLKGVEERAQLILQYKDKYRLERDELQKRVDACQNLLSKWKSAHLKGSSDYARGGFHARQDCEDELEQALKGEGQ